MKDIKVTKKPIYCIEKTADGRCVAKHTVEINGEEFSSVAVGNNESEAFGNLRTTYTRSLKNSKYGEQLRNVSDLDSKIGSPSKSSPEEVLRRKQNSPVPPSESRDPDENDEEKPLSQRNQGRRQKDNEEEREMIKGNPPNHVKWYTKSGVKLDGDEYPELKEPLTDVFLRPDDVYLLGNHNNHIILGRDHAPNLKMKDSRNLKDREYNSGFSNHMGASSIDLVAGRMSPFPLDTIGGEEFKYMPSFNSSTPGDVSGISLTNGTHPGFVCDASRIYMGQMTTVDENFKISKNVYVGDESKDHTEMVPTSAIMVKSDKIRMHARQDLKIVTGGPHEKKNSQGAPIKRTNGIHLMAGNGEDSDGTPLPQQPMVLGDNLGECLNSLLEIIKQVNDRLDAFVQMQTQFNCVLGFGFDIIPVPGAPLSWREPRAQWTTIVSTLKNIDNRIDGLFIDINNFQRIHKYLHDGGEKYINSAHNTVN